MEKTISLFLVLATLTSLVVCQRRSSSQENGRLSFLAVGDAGGSPYYPYFTKTLKKVANQLGKTAKATNAKFVIGLGDNFYWNGVKDVHDRRFQTTFEKIFRDRSLHRTTWYMLGGNHDYNGNISAQIAYTKQSKRWHFPHYYYTTVHKIPGSCKTVQIVTIDTTLLCYKGGGQYPSKTQQYNWIIDTLRKSDADYLVVAGHHPLYSVGMHGSNYNLQHKLKPLLEEYKVTAYFSGHDHNMQHIKPSDSTVNYFVSGSASNHNMMENNKWRVPNGSLKFFDGRHGGFTLLQATPKELKVSFITDRGKVLHSTSLSPRFQQRCSKRSEIPMYNDDDFEDSVLDAFFELQEEQERRRKRGYFHFN